jgi:hypothetical protein
MWRDAWCEKEAALRNSFSRSSGILNEHACPLQPLLLGDRVYVQNQRGNHPNCWDRSGFIVEVYDHDSYVVKVDGSGWLMKRNRKYLRKFDPASTDILSAPIPNSSRPGVKDTSPVAHLHPAQPRPQVELVIREAPDEDQTELQVFPATGNYQPAPNPMPMLRDFPATG